VPCFRVLFRRFSSQIIITNSKTNLGTSDLAIYTYKQSFNYRMRFRELIKSMTYKFQSKPSTFVFSLSDVWLDIRERSELKDAKERPLKKMIKRLQ
jgi:hypothetical protein